MEEMRFKLKTLSPIWTGGVNRGVNRKANKFHLSGIKGSIRWWYEALIRGLGGYACDPYDNGCSLSINEIKNRENLQKELDTTICPACQLFGCTGWAGKVKLMITGNNGQVITNQLSKNKKFILKFIPLKTLTEMEKTLLKITIKIIVELGSIGGRTVLKPSDHGCTKNHHNDYGLLAYQNNENDEPLKSFKSPKQYSLGSKTNNKDHPNLRYFWFVKGGFIKRAEHNKIVNRDESHPKKKYYNSSADEFDVFVGGYIKEERQNFSHNLKKAINNRETRSDSESKKIFSFKTGNRCWGYVRNDNELIQIKEEIKDLLDNSVEIRDGKGVLSGFGLLQEES